ncbi:MAG: hypothetical protein E6598_01660 [Streptococcus mitis]|nr:hypothetical protein [Streptococcus mitis]MQQ66072.1 hypothetical protein [Streptococcus mitis]
MKKKTYIKLMAATVLASTLLLGACGNKKETTQASSSVKTSQSSSSKAVSSSKESKTQKSSSSASSEKTKASTDQSSATATPSQAAPAPEQRQGQEVSNQQAASQQTPVQASSTQQAPQAQSNQSSSTTDRKLQDKQAEQNKRYKGVLTMVDGDFSAAAGNWKGANGETITVSSGGQFTVESADGKKENYSIKGYSYTLDDGKYNAKIGGGKVIQITTGADGKVSSVALNQ